jgi:uncharacterized protein (DUF2344 family)
MNIVLRALRSSGIKIKMHGKYHPMPKIVLSDALPIGIESTCEGIEIDAVRDVIINSEIVKRVNRSMPDGMKIQEFIEGTLKDMVKEYLYILITEEDIGNEFELWKKSGRKFFYLWRGIRAKTLLAQERFERIIKIEARRIYGG